MSGTVHGRTVSLEVYYAQDRLMLSTISRAERHRLRAFCSASIHSVFPFINPTKCSISWSISPSTYEKFLFLGMNFFWENIYLRCFRGLVDFVGNICLILYYYYNLYIHGNQIFQLEINLVDWFSYYIIFFVARKIKKSNHIHIL